MPARRTSELEAAAREHWVFAGRAVATIHCVADGRYDGETMMINNVRLGCGRRVDQVWVTYPWRRETARRCAGCCSALGIPSGHGSPGGDRICRSILGWSS